MRSWALVVAVSITVVLARMLDLWSTWALSPNLEGERNILITFSGQGWELLLAVNAVVVLLVVGLFTTAVRLEKDVWVPRRGLGYVRYLQWMVWGRFRHLRDLWWTWPPRRRYVWIVGSFMPWAIVVVSLVAAGGNVLAVESPAFRDVWAALVVGPVQQLGFLLAVILVTGLFWSVAIYDVYRHGEMPAGDMADEAPRG